MAQRPGPQALAAAALTPDALTAEVLTAEVLTAEVLTAEVLTMNEQRNPATNPLPSQLPLPLRPTRRGSSGRLPFLAGRFERLALVGFATVALLAAVLHFTGRI